MYFSPLRSENQIIVRCKQPIKVDEPLQYLMPFAYSVGERIVQTVFAMSSIVLIIVIQFMLLGTNIPGLI